MGSSRADGLYSLAVGYSSATNTCATALGYSTANGPYASALGFSSALNDSATAMGYSTSSGYGSTAMGNSSATATYATAMGSSSAGAEYSTAIGSSSAAGIYSFAGGLRARAKHDGSFVWADNHSFDFTSTLVNKVRFRCTSGFDIITGIDGSGNQTAGVFLGPAGTAWTTISDRNAKKNVAVVDTAAVLEKLAAIQISKWNYNWEADTNTPHMGPMAQDFKAAFYPGRDDKSISTLEFDGVALAAIQGLNKKVEEQRNENAELKRDLAELKKLVREIVRQRPERSTE